MRNLVTASLLYEICTKYLDNRGFEAYELRDIMLGGAKGRPTRPLRLAATQFGSIW
jgi:hypothetical protein